MDYFIYLATVLAFTTSVSLPQAFQDSHYSVPVTTSSGGKIAILPETTLIPRPSKIDADAGPVLLSQAALVMDERSGAILFEKNADTIIPLASISKLMTAVVTHQHTKNWTASYTLTSADNGVGGSRFAGETDAQYTKLDLLKAMLIGSANNAAYALANSTTLSFDQFIEAMNSTAHTMGMRHTTFIEPSGLSANNVSTAQDIAILMRTAAHYPLLLTILGQPEHHMKRLNDPDTASDITVHTTNRFTKNADPRVIGGKTGFTYEAGNCLVNLATNSAGQRIIVVTLGADDPDTRFEENGTLIDWTYQHYQW